MTTTAELAARYQQLVGRRDLLKEDVKARSAEAEQLHGDWKLHEAVTIIGRFATEKTRNRVKQVFDGIGTSALQAVFDADSTFSLEFVQTPSGKRQARMVAHVGDVKGDPLLTSGNSTAAVLSTVLRRAVIILHPKLLNLLIADEPLSGLDTGRVRELALIDRDMVDDHGMQYIAIVHEGDDEYTEIADSIVSVDMVNGVSEVSYK